MDDERTECCLLGRVIGTATGWDDAGNNLSIMLYDFMPINGSLLPAGESVVFDMTKGTAISFDENGNEIHKVNILDAMQSTALPTKADP